MSVVGVREFAVHARRILGRVERKKEPVLVTLYGRAVAVVLPVEEESMRVSDADRDRVGELLREQTVQGRLTLDEFEQRLDRAGAAKTWGDLSQLTRDLPVGQPSWPMRRRR